MVGVGAGRGEDPYDLFSAMRRHLHYLNLLLKTVHGTVLLDDYTSALPLKYVNVCRGK